MGERLPPSVPHSPSVRGSTACDRRDVRHGRSRPRFDLRHPDQDLARPAFSLLRGTSRVTGVHHVSLLSDAGREDVIKEVSNRVAKSW